MNRQRYRIVFNRVRGLLMAVAEHTRHHGKGDGVDQFGYECEYSHHEIDCFKLGPLHRTIGLIFGYLLVLPAQAAVVAYKPAPKTQQPTILNAGNGVPLVNIQTPSAAGVSHNKYSQFDVDQQGVILNNARADVQTLLGGWVQGNPWLAKGAARVILNEVISSNPSQLLGYVEVAGSRAEVIIANPSGISCNSCGFINAGQATLTTGQPIVSNGNLESYRVEGGTITIHGGGLDASRTDYANLIARAVEINAGIWTNTLTVTAGANRVNQASGSAVSIAGSGAAPAFAIDVSALGGMYAGKITLVGTEAGVGVRNAGEIGSGGALVLKADGILANSGRFVSDGDIGITLSGAIENNGMLYARGNALVSSEGDLENHGIIAAMGDNQIITGGHITGHASSLFAAGLKIDGSLADSGKLMMEARQRLSARGRNLAGADQTLTGSHLELGGSETVGRNLTLLARGGDLDATDANLSAAATLSVNTPERLTTDGAKFMGNQLNLNSLDLSNAGGELLQTGAGDLYIALAGLLDNTAGRIASNSANFHLGAQTLINNGGHLQHAGSGNFRISATRLEGGGGSIASKGVLDIAANNLNLNDASTSAVQLRIDSTVLTNRNGEILQTGAGVMSITAISQFVNVGGHVASNGSVEFNLDALDNRQGRITALEELGMSTRLALDNRQGLIASGRTLRAQARGTVDNAAGTFASLDGDLAIQTGGDFRNVSGTLSALRTLTYAGEVFDNTDGRIQGAVLSLDTRLQAFRNAGGSLIAVNTLSLQSGALNNDAGLVQSGGDLDIDTHGQILSNINSGASMGILAQGNLKLSSGDLDNHHGYLAAQGSILSNAAAIHNSDGIVIAGGAMNLNASGLDNQAGRIEAAGDLVIDSSKGHLDNRGGLLRSAHALNVSAGTVDNRNTLGPGQGIEATGIEVDTSSLDNASGAMRANDSLSIAAGGSINNRSGLISSLGTLNIRDPLARAGSNVADKTLFIANTGGTLIAGTRLSIDSQGLGGDGRVLSEGDLVTKLTTAYAHSGEWQANGDAIFQTTGTLINQSKLLSGGELRVSAGNFDNRAAGEIVADTVTVAIAGTLINRGLIDGGQNFISAGALDNLGSGRIYGDQLAIAATDINNADETVDSVLRSAVIAARERLDVGAHHMSNLNGALLFSAGDMLIGGGLDEGQHAIGSADRMTNFGATVEAMGNLAFRANEISNINANFSTQPVLLGDQLVEEYSLSGSATRYDPEQVYVTWTKTPGRIFAPPDTRGFEYLIGQGFFADNSNNYIYLSTPQGSSGNFWLYSFTRGISETSVQTTAPGRMIAGGNITIAADRLLNDQSQILAGGSLLGEIRSLTNTETTGQRTITERGVARFLFQDKDHDDTDQNVYAYAPAPRVETFLLSASKYAQHVSGAGSGMDLADFSTTSVNQSASGSHAANTNLRNGSRLQQVAALSGIGGTGFVIRSVTPNISVPGNSLYRSNPGRGSRYLVETDPAFASYRAWLSSDYMLNQLAIDPALTHKRLGDGFYEQRLIREQVAQLTGRRFLDGYTSDEAQYQALMAAGVTYARELGLAPGIALSEAQMVQLTSDIVWLVAQTVTLADGSMHQVLVPQVYVMARDGDLLPSGALIAGDSVDFDIDGDLINAGTIAGRNAISLNAENIRNLGGRISANSVQLQARSDLDNLGGRLEGGDLLRIEAGRDINVETMTSTQTVAQGSRTNIERLAGLYVSNPNAVLVASTARDLNLVAAEVLNSGVGGRTLLAAGNDLVLGTITSGGSEKIGSKKHNRAEISQIETGTVIDAQGDVTLGAGRDLNARAAMVSSDGAIVAGAGQDITIEAGSSSISLEENHRYQSKGFLSSKKTITRDTLEETGVVSSTFSGHTVDLTVVHDLALAGSNVVGTSHVNLIAGNNLTLDTAQATYDETHLKKTSKSGVFGNGAGFTVGSQKLKTTNDSQQVINIGSTVGSVAGNVDIEAGKQYTQTGSAVLAPKGDIGILAQQVDINAATDTYAAQQTSKFKSSGLSVSVGSSLVNLGEQVATSAQNTLSGDAGDQRLHALQTYANGATLYEQGTAVGKALQAGKVQDAAQAAGAKISVSLGTTKSSSSSSTQITTQQGSAVMAGGNVLIRATEDDLTVQGSEVSVGKNLALLAAENLNLLAGVDTEHSQSKNKSSSASIGVSAGVGAGMAGVSVDAAVSRGKGKANSDSTTFNNTHVSAGETLVLQSGSDTNLIGASASGKRVVADIGGNLNLESLQDTATSQAKQSNAGMSVSVPVTSPGKFSASVSQSREKANSDYASVYEQSGIEAGSEGFQIHVQDNTDLKGALIDSTAKADKNHLTTGTLTVSDIENRMEAKTSSSGTTVSSDMLTSKYAATKGLARNALDHGEAETEDSSTTRSAVAPGTVVINDEAKQLQLTGQDATSSVAALDRETTDANRVLAKPDTSALQDKAQRERAENMLLFNAVTSLTDEAYRSRLVAKPKLLKVECTAGPACNSDPRLLRWSEATPQELAEAGSGAVMATNGILNGEQRAAELAYQNVLPNQETGEKPQVIYVLHIAPGNNFISEMLGTAYENITAKVDYGLANFLGYTNGQEVYADLLKSRGDEATVSLGHSRGTLTQSAAFTILANLPDANGNSYTNSGLTVRGVGGAENAVEYTDKAVAITTEKGRNNITYNYFSNDPVATFGLAGGNPGVWSLKDLWQVLTTSNSMHSCYGSGAAGCMQVEIPVPGGPQGTPEGNAKLIQYQGGMRIDKNPIAR